MLKHIKDNIMPKFSKSKGQENLDMSISDCSCPICLEVLIEPVKMPCSHELCLKCLDTMLDQTNLCCPMCRVKISSWSRNARSNNTLVNTERWKQIQKLFPDEIKNRLNGTSHQILVDSLANAMPAGKKIKCSEDGEIRKEYLEYMKRVSCISNIEILFLSFFFILGRRKNSN
jgi:hypothetical protein